jgi:hypothetical protein
MLYMVTWIPSIYPLYVSINILAPWIRHGIDLPSPIFPAWGGGGPGTSGRTLVEEHLDEGHAQAEDITSRGGSPSVFGMVILYMLCYILAI